MATRPQPQGIIDDATDEDTTQTIPGTRQLLTQPEPDPDSEQSVIDRLRAVMASSPGDRVKVKVYRVDPKQSSGLIWCQDYTPAEYEAGDLGMIRDTWGPGRYQIRIICPTGIAGRSDVTISAPMPGAQPLQMNPAPAAESSATLEALRMMMESQSRILEALQNKPDPRADMLANLEMMKAMREAFAPAVTTTGAPAVSPTAQLTELMQTLRLFKEAAADIGADKEPAEPSLVSMLPGVLSLVREGMQPQQAQLPAPIVVPQSIERSARVANPLQVAQEQSEQQPQQPQQPQTPTDEEQQEMILILRGQLAQLCKMAKDGKPASEGGEFLYENLPDELLPELNNPQWFEILASFAPKAREHEAWFREAKAVADELFNAPDEEDPNPAAIAPKAA
jgi:hypothetical protein